MPFYHSLFPNTKFSFSQIYNQPPVTDIYNHTHKYASTCLYTVHSSLCDFVPLFLVPEMCKQFYNSQLNSYLTVVHFISPVIIRYQQQCHRCCVSQEEACYRYDFCSEIIIIQWEDNRNILKVNNNVRDVYQKVISCTASAC